MSNAAPAPYPCVSCPYRRDVPSGVWAREEYAKLPCYDGETGTQPLNAFFCHQQNGRLCSGWVGCHDMQESLGLRVAMVGGAISPEDYEAALDYECPVPLFGSGAEAARHGLTKISRPGEEAQRMMRRLLKRWGRRGAA